MNEKQHRQHPSRYIIGYYREFIGRSLKVPVAYKEEPWNGWSQKYYHLLAVYKCNDFSFAR